MTKWCIGLTVAVLLAATPTAAAAQLPTWLGVWQAPLPGDRLLVVASKYPIGPAPGSAAQWSIGSPAGFPRTPFAMDDASMSVIDVPAAKQPVVVLGHEVYAGSDRSGPYNRPDRYLVVDLGP